MSDFGQGAVHVNSSAHSQLTTIEYTIKIKFIVIIYVFLNTLNVMARLC